MIKDGRSISWESGGMVPPSGLFDNRDKKELKEAITTKKKELAALQRKVLALRTEGNAAIALVTKIRARNLPEEFCNWLTDGVKATLVAADEAAKVYAEETVRTRGTLEEVQNETMAITEAQGKLNAVFKEAKKGIYNDVRKNAA